ncbi:hypothetical protein [Bradyrhizobium japonicum]|uniref:hypothetical protein n=1 Tax=Bradyrhizobium japonicum TaxID=375 RepID=UPI002714908C|nr:hypothetical protein [Bradyrhizobium japonicum]WLB24206.1 hypothetical protein QIH95_47400 [Bradyrhizobium japonicum]
MSRVIAGRLGFEDGGRISGRILAIIENRQARRGAKMRCCVRLSTPPNTLRSAIASGSRLRLFHWSRNCFMGTSVHGEAGCIVCCQPRVLKALFPVAEGVELKLYECAGCASSMWLITKVSIMPTPKRGKDKARADAAGSVYILIVFSIW